MVDCVSVAWPRPLRVLVGAGLTPAAMLGVDLDKPDGVLGSAVTGAAVVGAVAASSSPCWARLWLECEREGTSVGEDLLAFRRGRMCEWQ